MRHLCVLALMALAGLAGAATSIANDTCTGTDGTAITAHTPDDGGSWTVHPNAVASASIIIATNRLRANKSGDDLYYHSGTPASADYDVECDVFINTKVGSNLTGINGRMSTSVKTMYTLCIDTSGTRLAMFKNVTGTATLLGSATPTLNTGTSYHLKLEMRGTTINGYIDGVLSITVTDSAISATGKPGIWTQGALSNSTGIHIDNFSATNAPAATFNLSPTSIYKASTGNTITLTGTGTAWSAGTPGTPTFTLSGGTGASITAQVVASATSATITVSAGSATGTLTITDPSTSLTATITVTNTGLAASASTVDVSSTGNSITVTGTGTAWTPGTPGSPTLTLSGGTAAAITAQTLASTTSGTITLDAGISAGPLTITDPTGGGTVTITVVDPSASLSVTDSFTDTDGVAITAHTPDTGGTWSLHPSSVSGAAAIIATNRIRANHSGDNIFYHSNDPATPDYIVEADLRVLTLVAGNLVGVHGRCSTSVKTNYFFGYSTDSAWHLFKNVSGSFTDLGSFSQVLSTSTTYHIKLEMLGSTINGYVDGVLRITATDSAITAAGKCGIWMQGAITNSTGIHLDNFTARDSSLSIAPSSVVTGTTGNSIVVTGFGTSWSAGTPGTPTFTLSGGTGASITAQTVTNATTATLTITAGSAPGALTITDPSTSATATLTAAAPTTAIAINDANIYFSPANWKASGSTYAETTCNGAYLKMAFTGTTALAVTLDHTPLTGGSVATSDYPKVVYSLNGGALTTAQPTAGTITVSSSLTSATTYTFELWMKSSKQTIDRWTTPREVIRLTGFTVDSGGTTLPLTGTAIAIKTHRAMFLGDSITEGVDSLGTNSGDLTSNDAYQCWPRYVANALNAEYAQVGYGFQGYVHTGNGSVPKLVTSYKLQANGVSRTLSGFDYVFVNMGTNDTSANSAALSQSDVAGFITDARTNFGASTSIFIMVPFSQINQTAIAAATNAARLTDSNVYLLDLGVGFSRGLTGGGTATANAIDSLHPNQSAHALLGAAVARAAQNLLTPYATQTGGGGGTRRLGAGNGLGL